MYTEEWLDEHDLLEEIDYLQRHILDESYQLSLAETFGKHKKAYQYGVSFQPGGGPERAQLTKSAREEAKVKGAEINYKLLDFCNKVAAIGLPELASQARRHDNLKHASMVPGPKNSVVFTNQQQNFAALETNLGDEIGKFGDAHPDWQDDPTSLTFMLNLSNIPTKTYNGIEINEYHGGRFCIPALKAAIPMRSRPVVGFAATFLHFALPILRYSVTEDSPLRLPPTRADLPSTLVQSSGGPKYSFARCTIPVYTDVKMKYPKFATYKPEIFTRNAGLALYRNPHAHQEWMANFFMRFEEMVDRYITINYNDQPENLFGMGPRILIAALSAYMVKWRQESIIHKLNKVDREGRAREYGERSLGETREKEKEQREAAAEAAKEANVTLVANPPATADIPQTRDADRQFRCSEIYANLFGWIDEAGQKNFPAVSFIDEVKRAIVSPNAEFDQLKRDLETISCGKKFPNKKGGGGAGLLEWTGYQTNWDLVEEGISGNPDWTRESLGGGVDLQDLVNETYDR